MKKNDELEDLKKKLLPILERAAIGDYTRDIKLEKGDPMNIVYGGIQVLINTIREQAAELQGLTKPTHSHYISGQPKTPHTISLLKKSHIIRKKRR